MKSKLPHRLLLVTLACALVHAAAGQPTLRPKPERFAEQIATFVQQAPEKEGIVFAGSSSIARWKTLKQDFAGLPVRNRGFGGSVANDLIVYLDAVVLRHKPRVLVVYTGGNDIHARLTVDEAFADYTHFASLVHEKLPKCRIIINSAKISIKRNPQIPQITELNHKLEAWAKEKDWGRRRHGSRPGVPRSPCAAAAAAGTG